MTFDEWAKENWMYIDVKANARVIWDAAQSAKYEEAIEEIDRLKDGYSRLINASDSEMADGDLARDIAASMLTPN